MQLKHQTGFTLLELIVVLVLIGVLAVSLVPRFFDSGGTSEYLYRDQALNVLRRVQMQAMQCTSCASTPLTVQADRMFSGSNSCTNDATHLCITGRDAGNVTLSPNGFAAQLIFDANGKPTAGCASGNCSITVQGTYNLRICIEAEGYIHAC